MIRFQVIPLSGQPLDQDAIAAVAIVKEKCRSLVTCGIRDLNRAMLVNGVSIVVRCISMTLRHGGEDLVVKLLVQGGGDGSILYAWEPHNNGQAVGPCRLAMLSTDPASLPASQRVTAVGLSALANGLSFTEKVFASPSFVAAPLLTLSRITTLLERMVRVNSLFAQQMLGWLIARTTITRHGQTLRTVLGDCILSRWTGGDFYLLLGSFPRAGEAPQTVAGAPLADQPFNGVIVAWSVLKAALQTGGSPTVFQVNLDAIVSHVNDVVSYTRKDVYHDSAVPEPSTGGTVATHCAHVPTTSPYASVYEISSGDEVPGGSPHFQSHRWEVHRLSGAGLISVEDMTASFVTDTTVWSDLSALVPTISAAACDLVFFTGDAFVKYGTNASSGTSGGSPYTFTERVNVKPAAGARSGADVVDFRLYVPELGMVVSAPGDGSLVTSILSSEPTHTLTLSAGLPAVDPAPFGGVGPPYLSAASTGGAHAKETEVILGTGPYVDLVGSSTPTLYPTAAGAPFLVPFDTTFDPPIMAGHPVSSAVGGVYWPRDGAMGVFIFQLPNDAAIAAARTADVAKYQNIYNAAPGYRRIVNADGSVTLETGYQDPEVVIGRIAAATTVIANNFASPALYPWLTPGISGVILDP